MSAPSSDHSRARELFRKGAPPSVAGDELPDALLLRDIGMDSLAVLLIVTSFCETFAIELDALPGEIGRLDTVGEVIRLGVRLAQRARELQSADPDVSGAEGSSHV